ncbi:hypothetical protein LTR10_024355 [Elasticomyces elasticus]|uniref:Uncharacterized protein n=1 Tax=Exophiala sideris TaxID=1016849 RepID=A0ABR0JMD3_9EURO|nr:hypothetical protein LTR10_024355 [Elasticomyces elasticus]KAK5036459.1 hypothetical protein LTS07_002186 [Exophiala sideris]KAK5041712.1 hypothetical protein LTR13_002379 [Exophiala sideris]KAK5066842.1 hypothetical protein LTR69_002190 [Exophiala sideris]KAK5184901.1 hypothetical protein LTR44_002747 [Eurotiomycetes sp. CCFEE 6388]
MEKSHVFIAANHPHMHFVGRWTTTVNQLRRDAAFPGSYVEMVITNTTSIHLSLNNRFFVPEENSKYANEQQDNRLNLQPVQSDATVSQEASIMLQLENDQVYGAECASGIIKVASQLDPDKKYKIRVTHFGGPNSSDAVLEFEGIWVDKASSFAKENTTVAISTATRTVLLDPRLPDVPAENGLPDKKPHSIAPRRTIEILTSETAMGSITGEDVGEQIEKAEVIMNSRVNVWYNRLSISETVDTAIVPTNNLRLLPTGESCITVQDLFFRSGPPGTAHFARPWSFQSHEPSVLILQLGLLDFMDFYSEKANRNKHAVEEFTNDFVKAYVKFIQTIRRTAYPFDKKSMPSSSSINHQDDGSYVYNSAPSTLPIFLIAPFSASRRFVTRKSRLDQVISTALQQVVNVVQLGGDKSTFWIDTTGWLDHKEDFIQQGRDPLSPQQRQPQRLLSQYANFKVASLLSGHLCPYMQGGSEGGGRANAAGQCPFDRHNHYQGDVYLPQNVDFDRAILERKITRIKEQFNIQRADSNLVLYASGRPKGQATTGMSFVRRH